MRNLVRIMTMVERKINEAVGHSQGHLRTVDQTAQARYIEGISKI
jgi:hypothetical protein